MADDPTPVQQASPITVGELTDVPAPLSPIAAQFHQEVANRIVHRFPTAAAMNAWAAGNGSAAYCAELDRLYMRLGGAWVALGLALESIALPVGILARQVGVYGQDIAAGATTQLTNLSVTFTATPVRWYRTRFTVPAWLANGANPMVRFGIVDAAAAILADSRFQVTSGPSQLPPVTIETVESGLTGSVTRRAVCNASAAGTVQLYFVGDNRAALYPFITVEDVGNV